MICRRCGIQLRAAARFCCNCGAPVDEHFDRERADHEEVARRVTVVLPSPPVAFNDPDTSDDPDQVWAENEQAVILPISDQVVELEEAAEIVSLNAPRQARASRKTNPEPNQSRRVYLPQTEVLQRESEAKPFFTQVLSSGLNRQHHRLAAIVPLLLLIVILLFIFAYIAAK